MRESWFDVVGGRKDEAIVNFSLRHARDAAWRVATTFAGVSAEGMPAGAAKPAADPAAETRDYEAALNLFKAGKHKSAQAAFLAFIKAYPASPFLPSAHYWAGSAHYQTGEYKKAIELFTRLATTWPEDAKAPDALLGQANCQQESGDAKGARKTRETLVAKYPNSAAAAVARQRLAPTPPPKKK